MAGLKGEGDEASGWLAGMGRLAGCLSEGWRAGALRVSPTGRLAALLASDRPVAVLRLNRCARFAPSQVNIEVETQTQAIVDTVERVLQKYVAEGRLPALPQQ